MFPTIDDNVTTDGTGLGSFISNLDNLIPGTLYFVRAYAVISAGVAYGIQQSFTTESDKTDNTDDQGGVIGIINSTYLTYTIDRNYMHLF
jgi:hypothetical protein